MSKTQRTLAEKWGIIPWLKIRIDREPAYLTELVTPLCDDNKFVTQGVCDLAFVAPTSAAEWKQKAKRLRPAIDPDGVIWVLYPKEDFREKYRFDGSLEEMVQIVKSLELRQTKLVGVNDELTSARFSL
jgi:hypothetical protein